MEFIKDISGGKQYYSNDHLVDIMDNKDITIKYAPQQKKQIPGFLVPRVQYFHGRFTADFSFINSVMPEYPEDIDKIKQGISLTQDLVKDLQEFLKGDAL